MPETILVVDDDPHIIELAELYLEQEGFRVIRAGTAGPPWTRPSARPRP
jgi:DNA-binding response OmpR family regulator